MPRLKPLTLVLGLYIPILLVGLLLPRSTANDIDATPMGIISRILHEILYLTGPPEIFLNFLLFIPFFLALSFLNPALSRYWAALISCLTSAAAELAQSQIPGRVSSMRDFFSNCVGVVLALTVATALSKVKTPK
jgi:glycopeptide antibiotics resistance protein